MYIADLHIHSKYSRATSKNCDLPNLDFWARRKGITLVGTGDFTHPAWRQEMADCLAPAEQGLYKLREDKRLDDFRTFDVQPRFVVSGEISCIYKQDGRVRKVHNVILLPSLDAAERLSLRLEEIGNIHSDGRPILGLSSRDLLAVTLDVCPEAIFIPAHIWTPHFSLFGAFSGFDTLEACFGDLSGHIHALETGLSSDPPMNRRVPLLDGYTMVSNSDAHSPAKLGRECNLLSGDLSYSALKRALETGEGFAGTVEFFPEEGKYHLDGHRNCGLQLTPAETEAYHGRCPVCGKKITIGVLNRVEQLAERPEGYVPAGAKPFEHLMPLPEVISASLGISETNAKTERLFCKLLTELGSELEILRERTPDEIRRAGGELLAEGIRRLRAGSVYKSAGFDGEYGKITLFTPDELKNAAGQLSFLSGIPVAEKAPDRTVPVAEALPAETAVSDAQSGLNEMQLAAAGSAARVTAVVAGPGTGKTFSLVDRIARLTDGGADPERIAAVTFTCKAADELRERLTVRLGKRAEKIAVGTFHALCLDLLGDAVCLADASFTRGLAAELLREYGCKLSPRRFLQNVSAVKNGLDADCGGLFDAYNRRLAAAGFIDFDDLIRIAVKQKAGVGRFEHIHVDEFQDVNRMQYELVQQWLAGGQSLFVIGDPDQAIYAFRGAAADCFAKLTADCPDAAVIRLTKNYRSTPQIVNCAQRVIAHNPQTAGDRLLGAVRPAGAQVRLVECASDLSEGIFIAKEIARLTGGLDMVEARVTEKPRAFGEIAVLARTHRQLKVIESCLRRDGIPCVAAGRADFTEAPCVVGTLAFFRALVSKEPAAETAAVAFLDGQANFETAKAVFAARLSDRPRTLLADFKAYLHLHSADYDKLIETAHYADLPAFLQAMLLGGESDVAREIGITPAGAVRLSTLHGAKGLEFPIVFLCGMTDALPADADLQEERRLFYVGLTRAADELCVTTYGAPSPLLADLPAFVKREKAYARPAQQLSFF